MVHFLVKYKNFEEEKNGVIYILTAWIVIAIVKTKKDTK